jgi:hypothetical protein
MFYRSSNKILLAAIVAALGVFAPTRADDQTNDIEQQLKQKESQLKELEQKLKANRDKASEQGRQPDQVRQKAEQIRFTLNGQPPLRTRVEASGAEAIRFAALTVRDAKGDDEKSAAQKKLNEALSKYFDEDMVQREKELKQVEERVAKLHDLLDRRRSSKQEIIDLEAKVALNQANGLGFYDGETMGGGPLSPFFGWAGKGGSAGGFSSHAGLSEDVLMVPPVPPVKISPPREPFSAGSEKP